MFCHNDALVSSVSDIGGSSDTLYGEDISSYTFSYAGGLTGFGTGTILCSENTGTVLSVAVSDMLAIQNDVQTIIVRVHAYGFLGGLIGYSDETHISLSGNSGDVMMINGIRIGDRPADNVSVSFYGAFISAVGGIAGSTEGRMSDVHNTGTVSLKCTAGGSISDAGFKNIMMQFDTSVGGIYGIMGGTSAAERVCSSGNIKISQDVPSMNTGPIRIEFTNGQIGKIAGTVLGSSASIENCYFRSDMFNYPLIGSGYAGIEAKFFNLTESDESLFELDFIRTWKISDTGHPQVWVRYDMVMIDVSENFNGSAKYSMDREYFFDSEGTLFSYTDKDGFSLKFANGYGDDVTIYTFIDGKKIFLETDGNNHYKMPSEYLLRASSGITLYIDGSAKMSPSSEPGLMTSAIISVFTALIMAVSVYNAKFTSSMLSIYDTVDEEE